MITRVPIYGCDAVAMSTVLLPQHVVGPIHEQVPSARAILLLLPDPTLPRVGPPFEHVAGLVPARNEAEGGSIEADSVPHLLRHLFASKSPSLPHLPSITSGLAATTLLPRALTLLLF